MKKRLFVTDIDGTLLQDKTGLSADVVAAAEVFVNKGNYLAICTGRSRRGVDHVVKDFPVNVPCPLMAGAILYDFQHHTVRREHRLHTGLFPKIELLMADYPELAVQVFTAENIDTIRTNDIFRAKGVRAEQQTKTTPMDKALHDGVCKILLVHEDRDVLRACKSRIEEYEREISQEKLFKGDFASRHFFEIVSAKAGKDKALKSLCEDLNIEKQDVYVAGDGLTDLPMFQHAAISFAPEDAIKEVREAADEIFPSAEKHGILSVLEYLNALKD